MINNKYKIFICATEQSGDNIGYNIISELLSSNKEFVFDGIGGSKMSPLLSTQFFSIKDFNSMGIVEIIFSITRYLKMINFLVSKIIENKYDLIITIDSPDFNYLLVKKLKNKSFNKKIIHIVAPSVWAWRGYRAKKFAKVFDELLVLFDFEIQFFSKYGLKTSLIGHPTYYLESNNVINLSNNNIAFLPGSRKSEIIKLFPYFNIAYKYLLKNFPNSNIFIPTLPHLKSLINDHIKGWNINTIVTTDKNIIENYYKKTSKALVCSGTASLEVAKRNIPQLVIYKLNYITELIAKNFMKIKYANILNIIENKMIVKEITNSKLNKKIFYNSFDGLMKDSKANINQIENVNRILKRIQSEKPPYQIAVSRIISYF